MKACGKHPCPGRRTERRGQMLPATGYEETAKCAQYVRKTQCNQKPDNGQSEVCFSPPLQPAQGSHPEENMKISLDSWPQPELGVLTEYAPHCVRSEIQTRLLSSCSSEDNTNRELKPERASWVLSPAFSWELLHEREYLSLLLTHSPMLPAPQQCKNCGND